MGFIDRIKELYLTSETPVFMLDDLLQLTWKNNGFSQYYPGIVDLDFKTLYDTDTIYTIENCIKEHKSGTVSLSSVPLFGDMLSFIPIYDDSDEFLALIVHAVPPAPSRQSVQINTSSLSAFSGQFRNPLTTIFSTMIPLARILSETEDKNAIGYLNSIQQNSYKILRNTANITQFSRYLTNSEPIKIIRCDLCEFTTNLCKAIEVMVSSLNIPFHYSVPKESVISLFDADKLSSTILNLIVNSFQFTRDFNEVSFKLSIKNDFAVFTVSDNGLGISQEVLANVFRPYFSHNPGGYSETHLGLGLTLARYAVMMHGGTITINSEEFQGTNVVFSIPIKQDDDIPLHIGNYLSDYVTDKFSQLYINLSELVPFTAY